MESLAHLIIPVFLLLVFFPKLQKKQVLMLAPLTLLADIDLLYMHSVLLHNIFFVIIVSGFFYFASRKNKTVFFIALFFLSSHVALDAGNSVKLFWPVYDQYISLNMDIMIDNDTKELIFLDKPIVEVKDFKGPKTYIAQNHSYVLTTEFALIALLALILALSRYRILKKAWNLVIKPKTLK